MSLDPVRLADVIADLKQKLGAVEIEEGTVMQEPAEKPDEPRERENPPMVGKPGHPSVHLLFLEVMRQVDKITKNERNTQQGYSFRGVDATVNVVGPALREMGLICVPSDMEIIADREVATNKGGTMRNITIRVHWQITGPRGDTMIAVTMGEANDVGDKATPKAMSVAFRELWLKGLCVPSGDPDVDSDPAPERGVVASTLNVAPEPGGTKFQELEASIKRAKAESGLRKQYGLAQEALAANEIAQADFRKLYDLVNRRVVEIRANNIGAAPPATEEDPE